MRADQQPTVKPHKPRLLVRALLVGASIACALAAPVTPAAAGQYFAVMPISAYGAAGELRPVAMALASVVPPPATVGIPYTFNLGTLLSLDGPTGTTPDKVQWNVLSGTLPAGLSLVGNQVTGTPTILTPPSPVTIQAQYVSGASTTGALASYPFQVLHPVTISLDAATLPAAYIGQPYQVDLTQYLALDGPAGTTTTDVLWQVSAGTLPPGLVLSGSVISGTPTTYSASPSGFTISAAYKTTSATQAYSISIASIPLTQFSGYRAWQDGTFAQSCNGYIRPDAAHVYALATGNGIYRVQPAGSTAFDVSCDMTTDGGGWTVFQRRQDGSVNFYLGHTAYVAGFGTLSGEHWLGLEKLRLLTVGGKELRVEVRRKTGATAYAKYQSFSVGAAPSYVLAVSGYSGTAGEALIGAHNGFGFTTVSIRSGPS